MFINETQSVEIQEKITDFTEWIYIIQTMPDLNKSSAVTEMGNRDHNRHGPKIGGICPVWGGGAGSPCTQNGLSQGLPSYQVVP